MYAGWLLSSHLSIAAWRAITVQSSPPYFKPNQPGHGGAVVGLMRGELIALACVGPSLDASSLRCCFKLDAVLAPADFPAAQHAMLSACAINPIFEMHSGAFLSAAARLLHKKALHCAVAEGGEVPPPVAACMVQVAPRRGKGMTNEEVTDGGSCAEAAGFSLFSFTKCLARRRPVHTRVGVLWRLARPLQVRICSFRRCAVIERASAHVSCCWVKLLSFSLLVLSEAGCAGMCEGNSPSLPLWAIPSKCKSLPDWSPSSSNEQQAVQCSCHTTESASTLLAVASPNSFCTA